MKIPLGKILFGLSGIILGTGIVLANFTARVFAVTKSDWNASRIIDDSVFFNPSSMSSQQIQNFLNAKVPVCDTNGAKMYNSTQTRAQWTAANGRPQPPYTCLKDYVQNIPGIGPDSYCKGSVSAGTKSAATIIKEVANACNINPQVILVTLQKEQSLITDDWPWPVQYTKATGMGCPDTSLGVDVDSNQNGCYDEYEGLFKQIYYGARQFQRYINQPDFFNYAVGRNSYVAYQANNPGCGGTYITPQTYATAALYNYTPYQPNDAALNNMYGTGDTCSAYGNRNFWRMFNDWFGSTKFMAYDCDSKVQNISCVWGFTKDDGSQFLTSSKSELDFVKANYNWIYEGIVFYVSQTQQSETIPVYRLRNGNKHFYSANPSEYESMKSSGNWIDEGIRFYSYPSSMSSNISHPVFRLYNSSNGHHYWTKDENRKTLLINSGYVVESTVFNSFSGLVKLVKPPAGRNHIYRLRENVGYFYTTNLAELDAVVGAGYVYEGVLTTANAANTGEAVYRLQYGNNHFYTTDILERNTAVSSYKMRDEGVKFYIDVSSAPIYRLVSYDTGRHLYSSDLKGVMSLANLGWKYEKTLKNSDASENLSIYRLYGNGEHFYTVNLNEAANIVNKGWNYQGVAFRASNNSGKPVYRLYGKGAHFYTTDLTEKNEAISKYGYVYEGVKFYVSQTVTGKPVYRLYGKGAHFYTTDLTEKNEAISKYGYVYEGVKFYAAEL